MSLVRRNTSAAPPPPVQPLHIKWRPQTLDDVFGQDAVVSNLKQLFTKNRVPHTFLFTGPSGTGKTTLARIVASLLGAERADVDAARYSGVENMRSILEGVQYSGLGGNGKKAIVVDECHALSAATWKTLLLTSEEPPEHLYWLLCTTEPEKVPQTIRTRCHAYDLKPVRWDVLAEYLDWVREQERLQIQRDFVDLAARQAQGSVRQGLVYLSMLDGIVTKEDAQRLLEDADAGGEGPITLARMIVSKKGFTWPAARALIEGMADISPETIRITVVNYAGAALLKTDDEKRAVELLNVLHAFGKPCVPSERMAPVLLAVGNLFFGA